MNDLESLLEYMDGSSGFIKPSTTPLIALLERDIVFGTGSSSPKGFPINGDCDEDKDTATE